MNPVISTSEESQSCKHFAVMRGYWNDNYIRHFSKHSKCKYSPPELNRGYAIRVIFIFEIVKQYIKKHCGDCQIVILGAGYDTLYWRLSDEFDSDVMKNTKIFEIDLDAVVQCKSRIIKYSKELSCKLKNVYIDNCNCVISDNYKLLSCDITDLKKLKDLLFKSEFNKKTPTLYIAECMLSYLDDLSIQRFLQFAYSYSEKCSFLEYDPILVDDKFGILMRHNLFKREHLEFKGTTSCKTLESHTSKFRECGWDISFADTVLNVYNGISFQKYKKQIDKCEVLDESYLLTELLEHYCFIIAEKLVS